MYTPPPPPPQISTRPITIDKLIYADNHASKTWFYQKIYFNKPDFFPVLFLLSAYFSNLRFVAISLKNN